MNREKKLLKNTLILTIGNICTKLITFFLLPLYTSVLSTEEYGVVDLLSTLVSLLLPIVTLQIEQGTFRNLIDIREDEKQKKYIISTSFISVFLQVTLYCFIFLFISNFIHNVYKWFLLLNVIFYVFASLLQQISRVLGDNQTYAISSFFSACITIVFNLFFILKCNLGAYGMLLGTAIGQFMIAIYIFVKLNLVKYIRFNYYDKKILKQLLQYSIPLIPNSISWWIFNASDRVIVSFFLGLSMNGILAAAHKFSTVYITFYNVFHLSWLESVSEHVNDLDVEKFYNKMLNTSMKLFLALGIGIIAVMPFIYSIMIDESYFLGYYQVPIIMIGSIFNVIVALETAIYVAKKNTKAIANTSIISAIINILVHLVLIKFIGLYAATISTMVAYMVMAIYRYKDIEKKYFKIEIDKTCLLFSIIILIILLPIYYSRNNVLCTIGVIIAIIYAFIINKDALKFLKNICIEKLKK